MPAILSQGAVTKNDVADIATFFGYDEKTKDNTIDTTNTWAETTNNSASTAMQAGLISMRTGATISSEVRLQLLRAFPLRASRFNNSVQFNSFNVEWSGYAVDPDNFDSDSILGMSNNAAGIRTSNDTLGFIFNGAGGIDYLADIGGVETTGEAVADATGYAHYRIKIDSTGVHFFINGALIKTVESSAAKANYLTMYLKNGVAADARFNFFNYRTWYE